MDNNKRSGVSHQVANMLSAKITSQVAAKVLVPVVTFFVTQILPYMLAISIVLGLIFAMFQYINPFAGGNSTEISAGFDKINGLNPGDWDILVGDGQAAGTPDAITSTNYADALKNLAIGVSNLEASGKTNLGLVQFVKNAANISSGYVWGWHGKEISVNNMKQWQQSPIAQSEEACSTDADVQVTLGGWETKPGFDCSGLIIGYMTFDANQARFTSNSHGYGNMTSSALASKCVSSGKKNGDNSWGNGATYGNLGSNDRTMPANVPVGAAVLKNGHVGVYIGNDPVRGAVIVEAAGYDEGVVYSYGLNSHRSSSQDFTWWVALPSVIYQ